MKSLLIALLLVSTPCYAQISFGDVMRAIDKPKQPQSVPAVPQTSTTTNDLYQTPNGAIVDANTGEVLKKPTNPNSEIKPNPPSQRGKRVKI